MEFNSLMFFFKKKCWYIINTMIWYLYFYFLFVCFCFFLALAPLCIHDTKLCTWEADPGVAVHCWEGFHKWSHCWVVHVHTFSRDSLKSGHFAQGPLSFRKLRENLQNWPCNYDIPSSQTDLASPFAESESLSLPFYIMSFWSLAAEGTPGQFEVPKTFLCLLFMVEDEIVRLRAWEKLCMLYLLNF